MADLALDDTVNANLQAKRNTRVRDREQRYGYGSGGYNTSSRSGYRGGTVGKYREDRPMGGFNREIRGSSGRDEDMTTRVLISNLEYTVSDVDIKELFCEFGKTRKVTLNYDKSGRSLGTAEVTYDKRSDAYRAMQQYNGVPLDGKPMIIEIVGAPTASSGAARQYSRPVPYGSRNYTAQQTRPTERNNSRRDTEIEKTAAELDKELDQYLQSAGKKQPDDLITEEALKPVELESELPTITDQEEKDILDAED